MQTRTPYTTTGTKATPARGMELQRLATIRQKVEEEGETKDVVRNCQKGGEIPLYWGDDSTFGVEINLLQTVEIGTYDFCNGCQMFGA